MITQTIHIARPTWPDEAPEHAFRRAYVLGWIEGIGLQSRFLSTAQTERLAFLTDWKDHSWLEYPKVEA
jgi:hypothetical protein